MKYLYRYRYLLFAFSLAVLLWGIFRQAPPPELFDQSDKALHLLAFFGFALISRFAFMHYPAIIVWPLVFCCAPLLEYLQHTFQPSRHFSEQDAIANAIGVFLAWLTWQVLYKFKTKPNA